MQPGKLIARLAILSATTVVCLLLAFLAPVVLKNRVAEEAFSGASVMASPRDMLVITQPIPLSASPEIVLTRGMLYADGNAALGTPISRFVLDSPSFSMPISRRDGAPRLDAAAAEMAPLVEQLLAFGYDTLIIRRGQAQVGGEGSTELLTDIEAEVTGRRKGQFSLRGSFVYRGQRIKFDTAIAQASEKKAAQRWYVKTALKSAFIDASFDGVADATGDLQLSGATDLTIPSLRRVARWLSLPVPNAEGLNATSLKGQLTWARNTLSVEQAKVAIDGNEGAGTLSLNLNAERPLIDGTLAFSSIDLAPYVEGLRPQTFGFERPSTSWSNLDLSFPLVRYIDTDLRVSTTRLTFKGFEMGRTAATFTVRAGKFLADVAEMELGAATASLTLTADTNEVVPRYTLKGKVQNFDAAQSAAALLSGASWGGKGTIVVDVAGTGQAPSEVLRSLAGKMSLHMPQGARLPLDLKGLRGLAKQGPQSGWSSILKGQTTLEALELKASIADGVATIESAQLKGPAQMFNILGVVKLPDSELDIRVGPRPASPKSPDAEDVRLTGALASPKLSTPDQP